MDNKIPFQPLPLRDEAQPNYEPIATKPTWKCYCCHDNGIIPERIVKTIMPSYVAGRHKPVKCNSCNIQLGKDFFETNTLDLRFTPEMCKSLAENEKQMWDDWAKQRHEQRKLRIANATKNLRMQSRTSVENLEVQRRHQDIIGK